MNPRTKWKEICTIPRQVCCIQITGGIPMFQISRKLAVPLSTALLLALSGCGPRDESENLFGVWQTELDLSQRISDVFFDDPTIPETLDFGEFKVDLTAVFDRSRCYSLSINEQSLDSAMGGFSASLRQAFLEYFSDTLGEDEAGVEAFLAEQGQSLDSISSDWVYRSVVEEAISDFETQGEYIAQEGRLYFLDSGARKPDEDSPYLAYELSGDSIRFTDAAGGGEAPLKELLPIRFSRITGS